MNIRAWLARIRRRLMPIQYPKTSLTFSNSNKSYGLRNHHGAQLIDVSFNRTGWDRNDGTAKLYLPKPIDACPMIVRNVDGLMDQTWWLDIYRFDRQKINAGPLLPSTYGSDFVRMFSRYGICELLPIGDDWMVQKLEGRVITNVNAANNDQYILVLGRVGNQTVAPDTWTDVEYNNTGWGSSVTALSDLLNPEYDSTTRVLTPSDNPGIPIAGTFKMYYRWAFEDPGAAGVVCEARAVNASGSGAGYADDSAISDGSNPVYFGQTIAFQTTLAHKWQVRHNHSGNLGVSGVVFYIGENW